jgi:uncharacterized OB-fold protein
MPISERLESVKKVRSWSDKIPLHYIYTAGIAGQSFMDGLKNGRIIVSRCDVCHTSYLPPKLYCVHCFRKVDSFIQVKGKGRVRAVTRAGGKGPRRGELYCYVTFEGIEGGLIHLLRGRCAVGDTVLPRFRPASERRGRITDIVCFVPA